ncbi:triose-phosphate isomerase, partial [bacterium]|nr:triose-phosphate isomerase [bacterium]
AGNWKMNLDLAGAQQLAAGLKREVGEVDDKEVVVFPSFPFLADVCDVLQSCIIEVGAQNIHPEAKGAYTGEVAGGMIKSVGCTWTLVGHSERRDQFAETDAFLNAKLRAALTVGLKPILCCGEHLDEREAGKVEAIVSGQIRGSLAGFSIDEMERITVAYEPVWAIGTGRTATPEQANEVHALIRGVLADMFSDDIAASTRILYGGSVKPSNAAELMAQPDIDGGLVGGASLTVDDFAQLARV